MGRVLSDQKQSDRHPPRWALPALLLTALALRGAATWHWRAELETDRDGYRAIAEILRDGQGFSRDGEHPTAFRPPLYPLFLAAALSIGGETAVALLQIAFGVATVWLTYLLGRRWISTYAGLLAAALVTVDPLLLRYTPQLMTETLFTFLTTLLLVTLSPRHPVTLSRQPSQLRLFAIGVLFGLCALCRPTIWAWGAIVGGIGVWSTLRNRKRGVAALGAMVAGLFVVVAPWVFRNAVQFGRPVVMTTHGGYTLLLGNNPVFYDEVVRKPWGTTWEGESLNRWQKRIEVTRRGEVMTDENEVARDRRLRNRAIDHIRDDPGGFAAACWLRMRRFWNLTPTGEARSGLSGAVFFAVGLYYAALFIAAVVGGCRLRKAEWPHWLPAVMLIVSFTMVHMVYWSNARMRSPLMPVVALLAARGLLRWRRDLDARAKR